MKRTLTFKLVICYMIAATSMFVLLNTYGVNRLKYNFLRSKRTVLYNEAALINSEYMTSYYSNSMSLNYLSSQLKTIDTFLDARIWIVNTDGELILDTRNSSSGNRVNIKELSPTFLDKTFAENVTIPGLLTEPMLSVVFPVSLEFTIRGYIVLQVPMRSISNESIAYIDIINISFLMFLIIMLLLFIYLYYLTIRPLHIIVNAARHYGSGDFNYPLTIKTNDEYKDLSDALTYMASEINSLDEYQKKFVANISHDFRSPLTSIKGYAEAILDGTIPVESQDRYLGIIVFETERLNHLTTNLLALNHFENKGGNMLEIASFDINHVITKTAESFERICTDKKITLNLVFSEESTFVDADLGKIQQVLYNLIDNAIKFSPANSKIKVSTEEKGEKIFVSVKDHGCGIPKDSVKKIWERFYKIDPSRGKDKKGTGLGLSITKEILIAHNENINVISTEGVGSEFIFTLPKSDE